MAMRMNDEAINQINRFNRSFGITSMFTESLFNQLSTSIKTRYGKEIYIDSGYYYGAIDWIKKYDNKFDSRPKDNLGNLKNIRYILKLESGTYCDVSSGTFIDRLDPYTSRNSNINLKVYIFGKKYKKYVKEFENSVMHNKSNVVYLYNIKGQADNNGNGVGVDSMGSVLQKRSMESLFYNDNTKETILNHIDSFIKNKHIYEDKSLTYKTGILLYGVPGTGKTSLAKALASYYNYNLIVLDIGTFKSLDTDLLTGCINADKDKFIILLEDIDTLFPSLDRKDDLDDNTRAIINKMLQFLDSASSPNDVIFIATTNDINKLDKAILRDGRFDIKVEIGNINNFTSIEMLKSFNIPEEDAIDIISNMNKDENGNINPAELQNKALAYFKKEL